MSDSHDDDGVFNDHERANAARHPAATVRLVNFNNKMFREAWLRLSKDEKRDYRRAMLKGRRASSDSVSRLVVQMASQTESRYRLLKYVVLLGALTIIGVSAVSGLPLVMLGGALFIFFLLFVWSLHFRRRGRRALAANLPLPPPTS